MARLEHDSAGFLVGKLVGVNDQLADTQQASLGALKGIRRDVSAIARALNVQTKTLARTTTSGRGGQRTQRVAPATTSSRGTRTAGGNAVGTHAVAQAAAKVTKAAAAVAVAGTGRDAKGRFTKAAPTGKQGADEKGEADAGIPSESTSRGLLGKIAGGIGQLNANIGAADNIDPTVNAMKEVTDVVSPLGRGLSFMFGRTAERRKERWYTRIIKAIQTPITKKGQEAAPVGQSGSPVVRMLAGLFGGTFGKLGAVFMMIPRLLMGVLSRIFLPLAAIWGAWELGKWIGEKIYAWLDESGWNQKLFDAVDWLRDTFSNAWKAVGEGIDSVVGMIEGAWKTITDGFKSALDAFMEFPKKIGEFFSGLDEAMRKLPVVGKAYAAAADAIKSTADDAKRGYEEGKSGATDKPAQTATQGIARDAGKVVAAGQEVGAQAKAGYTEARGGKVDAPAPSGLVQKVARAAGSGVGTVAQAGSNAALMLQAGRDAGMGNKELANFMGQNAHESGGFRTLSENLNYSAAGLRKTFGKYYKTDAEAAADARNPEAIANKVYGGRMGNTDPGDGYKFRGRGFTQLTGKANYAAAGKALGIDLVSNPDLAADPAIAAKISAWYWKTNVSRRGAGEDVTKATKLVNGGYNGLADRQKKTAEWEAKIAAAGVGAPATAAVASAGLSPATSASVPSAVPIKLPEQAKDEVPQKLNAGAAPGAKVQVALNDKTSQSIGDRGIAQIVTGGIGLA